MESTSAPFSIQTGGEPTQGYDRLPRKVWISGGIMILLGLVTAFLITRDVSSASYLYLAFYSIPANTAISVFPHEPVLIYFGKIGGILPAALAASLGTIVAGYLDHTVFVPLLNLKKFSAYKEKAVYRTGIRYFNRWPFATLVLTGFTPIPFWPFKILSFSVHYPMRKYLLALVVARFPRYVLLAWLGTAFEIPNWVLIAVFLSMFSLYFVGIDPATLRRWRSDPNRNGGPS